MPSRWIGVTIAIVLTTPLACEGNTYALVQPDLFNSHPFGFSGTVTTDGSIGLQTNTDFIESWAITIVTPSSVDGVSTELLTPDNSSVTLDLADDPGLITSAGAVMMPIKTSTPLLTLTWSTENEETVLQFTNRFTDADGLGAGVSVRDPSEPNSGVGIVLSGSPFAIAVPEPASAAVLILAMAIWRRRD